LRHIEKIATIQNMDTNENEIQSEHDEALDDEAATYEPYDGDTLMVNELAELSAVADETVQAVDALYGGVPPMESTGEYDALAVSPIGDTMAERETEREFIPPAFEPSLPMPPMTTLRRGQLGSVVPALLLIGIGAWLTLTTTAGTPPNPLLVAGAAVGAMILTLLAQWLSTGRWGRGYFFFAVILLLMTGIVVFSLQPGGVSLVRGWPLLFIALGIAVILSGLLPRPRNQQMVQPGIFLVIAGLLGMLITYNVVPQRILAAFAPWWFVVVIVLVLVWMLPLVFRRRE
jgi:hypothetical protein